MALFSLYFILLISLQSINCEPDRIVHLPGLHEKIPFRLYSGYLNASNGKHLHYMFAESENSPPDDPLILWLNGGPGCSSLLGFFTELGPFRVVTDDGPHPPPPPPPQPHPLHPHPPPGPRPPHPNRDKLIFNPNAWNKFANVLFLESPAGVGFSYSSSKNYTIDDDTTSMDNLLALKSFFYKYPQFRSNKFYLTGESYAGVYIPTLSVRLLSDASINYQGFAIGNGYLDQEKLGNSKIYFAYYHGLLDQSEWAKLTRPCCDNHLQTENHCEFVNNPNPVCNRLVSNLTDRIASIGLNPYNIYDTCDTDDTLSTSARKKVVRNSASKTRAGWKLLLTSMKSQTNEDQAVLPCVSNSELVDYLNDGVVRKALNIPTFVPKWLDCNPDILNTYQNTYKTLKKQVLQTLNAGKQGLIYNGDIDMVCDFLGDQWFVEDLGLRAITDYLPWHVNNQTAGFFRHFDKNLTLLTVRGAGHMVPTDRPEAALKMLEVFLKGHKLT